MNTTSPETPYQMPDNEEWMVPCLFFLLIVGSVGNTFGLLVFLSASMRKYSCSLYFLLMSIFDELTLFVWIANRLSSQFNYDQLRNRSTILCKLFVVITYNSAQSSIGMLVLATFDRLYTTLKLANGHFDVRLLTHRRRFQNICLSVFFLTIIGFNAVLLGSRLISLPDSDEKYCVIIDVNVSRIYSIIDLCLYTIVPCICMLIGDALILYYIRKSRARVISKHDGSKRRESQLSITLVITSIFSLLIVSPYSFFNVLVNFTNILNDDSRTLFTLNDAFGLLSTFTHAMHFYLFLIISSTIRKHFKALLNSFTATCSNARNVVRPAVIPVAKSTASSRLPINIVQPTPPLQTNK